MRHVRRCSKCRKGVPLTSSRTVIPMPPCLVKHMSATSARSANPQAVSTKPRLITPESLAPLRLCKCASRESHGRQQTHISQTVAQHSTLKEASQTNVVPRATRPSNDHSACLCAHFLPHKRKQAGCPHLGRSHHIGHPRPQPSGDTEITPYAASPSIQKSPRVREVLSVLSS